MKTLKKTYEIKAPADRVYRALTDETVMEKWSGQPVRMNARPGGEFMLWDGSIHGVNREVNKNKIVQDWQEKKWDKPSKVTFKLEEQEGLTKLELLHEEIPEASFSSIVKGWDEYYLGPLKQIVEKENIS